MYIVGYSEIWDDWTVSKVPDESLDFGHWSYAGRPVTIHDVYVVTTHYYDERWAEYGGTDYRYLIPEGKGIWKKTITEAFCLGHQAITKYMYLREEEQNSEWEDTEYAEGNEW